jgi:hypothetical protein
MIIEVSHRPAHHPEQVITHQVGSYEDLERELDDVKSAGGRICAVIRLPDSPKAA